MSGRPRGGPRASHINIRAGHNARQGPKPNPGPSTPPQQRRQLEVRKRVAAGPVPVKWTAARAGSVAGLCDKTKLA
ncbi:hypothetical protein NDU88_005696 [Pleurodeles waltl]|uniref:Uncharacterized protein n=1 Tax=Pleurodeles waltl TaxID=8319 RepID=A0AAV7NS65_PLEWA|nr:hypothetical protein NDU88_005696 [Pleurodeles waltl]